MVTVIVSLNLFIALFCFLVAWRVWHLRQKLATVADILADAESSTSDLLQQAPDAIVRGQLGVYQLRQHYQLLTLRLRQVQQILAVVGLGQLAWQRYRQYRGGSASTRRSSLGRVKNASRMSVNR